jgi:hypothetical protein
MVLTDHLMTKRLKDRFDVAICANIGIKLHI